jgi:hypothetical protein
MSGFCLFRQSVCHTLCVSSDSKLIWKKTYQIFTQLEMYMWHFFGKIYILVLLFWIIGTYFAKSTSFTPTMLTFSILKLYTVVMDTLKTACYFLKCSDIFQKNLHVVELKSLFQLILSIWYLLCVMTPHSSKLTFSKLCTVVMNTLKMCTWLFWNVQTFFKKFTCSWT